MFIGYILTAIILILAIYFLTYGNHLVRAEGIIENLLMFQYFTIIELVLLFLCAYFFGTLGFVVVSILSIALIYAFIIYGQAFGRSFANAPPVKSEYIDKNAIILSLIAMCFCIYFSLGLHQLIALLKYKQAPSSYFYIWLSLIIIGSLFNFLNYLISRDYSELKVIIKFNKEKKQKLALEKYKRKISVSLKKQFHLAMKNKGEIKKFIKMTKKIAINSNGISTLDYDFANYTTKLIIKYTYAEKLDKAYKIFNNYIDNLLPKVGFNDKSYDVASNALVLGIYAKDEVLCQKVLVSLLGENFNVAELKNEMLLFNLACYYAINGKKEALLPTVKQAIKLGKTAEEFLTCSDFEDYYEDKDFLDILRKVFLQRFE